MSKKRAGKNRGVVQTAVDAVVALALVGGIFLAMFGFSGNWPPLVLIESKSMQHSQTDSYIGTMDTGDLVMSKKVGSASDIVTYLSGKRSNYSEFGDYGDVVIYLRDGNENYTPIIHRAVIFLEAIGSVGFRAPELEHLVRGVDYSFSNSTNQWDHITDNFVIHHYGYNDISLDIPIKTMMDFMKLRHVQLHDGFVTKGDFNTEVDQRLGITSTREPIPIEWVVGKAAGEIPWVGVIKLWLTDSLPEDTPSNSILSIEICIVAIISVPIASEAYIFWKGRRPAKMDKRIEPEKEEKKKDDEDRP